MADILLATIVLAVGLFILIGSAFAAASKPIPGQGSSLRGPMIVGAVMTLLGVLWWAHIFG